MAENHQEAPDASKDGVSEAQEASSPKETSKGKAKATKKAKSKAVKKSKKAKATKKVEAENPKPGRWVQNYTGEKKFFPFVEGTEKCDQDEVNKFCQGQHGYYTSPPAKGA